MLKEGNVLFEASRLWQFCWFLRIHILGWPYVGEVLWESLDQASGGREKWGVLGTLSTLPFLTSH